MRKFDMAKIRSWQPCYDPSKYLPENWKGTIVDILKNKRIPHADRLWVVLRTELVSEKVMRLFAVWSYRQTLKFITNPDPRSVECANVAEKFAKGKATREQLTAATSAAWSAAYAARSAAYATSAARSAAYAAWSAAYAARSAAYAATSAESATESAAYAAWSAARSAAYAAWSAAYAARSAAYAATSAESAVEKSEKAQIKKLIEMIKGDKS